MKLLILIIIFISGCATSKTPFLISSKIKVNDENFKWKSFGPFEPKEAEAFMEERRQSIEELLAPKIDPYKGEDSTPEMCKQKNLPELNVKNGKGWKLEELSFYSSENMVLGLCANVNSLLKTRYQMLYCEKSKEVYVIQTFYNVDVPWEVEIKAACK